MPKNVCVKEVVREPRMRYFKVPRLGSYMAVLLKYDSCLFEEALDAGFEDFIDCHNKRQEQDKEK
jgi:hypothetical protein